jgi:hypothetical protein
MLYAQRRKRAIDTFVIFTDSGARGPGAFPAQALRDDRDASGIDARHGRGRDGLERLLDR